MNRRNFLALLGLSPLGLLCKGEKQWPGYALDRNIANTIGGDETVLTVEKLLEVKRYLDTQYYEVRKYAHDIAIYGTSGYKIDQDGNFKHIPIQELIPANKRNEMFTKKWVYNG